MLELEQETDNPQQERVILEIESQYDSSLSILHCGRPADIKQVDYVHNQNNIVWVIPGLWVGECGKCGERYVGLDDGQEIRSRIFEISFPDRAEAFEGIC